MTMTLRATLDEYTQVLDPNAKSGWRYQVSTIVNAPVEPQDAEFAPVLVDRLSAAVLASLGLDVRLWSVVVEFGTRYVDVEFRSASGGSIRWRGDRYNDCSFLGHGRWTVDLGKHAKVDLSR